MLQKNLFDKLDKLHSDRFTRQKRAPRLEHKCALDVHFACLSTTLIASGLTAWLKKWTGAIAQVEQVEQEVAQVCPMSIYASLIIAVTPGSCWDLYKFAQFLGWTHSPDIRSGYARLET